MKILLIKSNHLKSWMVFLMDESVNVILALKNSYTYNIVLNKFGVFCFNIIHQYHSFIIMVYGTEFV